MYKNKIYLFFIPSFIHLLVFIPFLIQSNIGSDWDAYSLIGTFLIFEETGQYLPSRPPGFPLYEFIIGFILKFSFYNFENFERLLLVFQFITTVFFNYLLFLFFKRNVTFNLPLYLIAIFSPIYLISGLTVIDYLLGSLFGFSAIYFLQINKKNNLIPILLALSIAIRLSNVIFVIAILIFQMQKKEWRDGAYLLCKTFVFSLLLYFPTHLNLIQYLRNLNYKIFEATCILNLTNTDHTLIDRLGRFFLKQINFFGLIAFILFLYCLVKSKPLFKEEHIPFYIIFLLFEISFLRLPTEEGHLIPAYIAFLLIVKDFNISKVLSFIAVVFVIVSSIYDLKFYTVDTADGANDADFKLYFQSGFLIEEYKIRNNIENKNFHYFNSKETLKAAWENGCPN